MLDTEIDELTKSIKEVVTGRSYETLITPATIEDLHATSATWQFDWNLDLANGDVFKLTVPKLGQHIHGLISLAYGEGYVWINVIESHPENVGRRKKYSGVAANLVAYACKLSFERGLEGFVSFDAKSTLID